MPGTTSYRVLDRLLSIAAVMPNFGLAALFGWTWLHPTALQPRMVANLLAVMLFEFIVSHSAAFMGVVLATRPWNARRLLIIAGLCLFYSAIGAGFAASLHSWWPLLGFWALLVNRLLGWWQRGLVETGQMNAMGRQWGAGVGIYVLTAFATILIPVPPLGITQEVVTTQGFTVGGLWPEQPWRVVAMGAAYFFLTGLVGLSEARREAIHVTD